MANEEHKDFNAMLHDCKDMPNFQIITDAKSIEKDGGNKIFIVPPTTYDQGVKHSPSRNSITG